MLGRIIIPVLEILGLIRLLNGVPPVPFSEFFNCIVTEDVCPNENVTFYLYTRNTQENPTQLHVGRPQSIVTAPFIKNRPVIVLIHGYTGHKDFSPNTEIRPAYFQHGEYNIISVDYHPLAPEPCYFQAVQNLPIVARCTAQLLDFVISASMFTLHDIHVIGFSLGAQTSGMIANYMRSGQLKRITGLDPAKPLFLLASADHKLGKNDAKFVDVIHTDILQRGVLQPAGHADFYLNGGIEQPGCNLETNSTTGGCNHARAPQYYAESINSNVGFWGFKCREWLYWALGLCTPAKSNELAMMGMHVSKNASGLFFVYTNKEPPFATGILPEFTLNDQNGISGNNTDLF